MKSSTGCCQFMQAVPQTPTSSSQFAVYQDGDRPPDSRSQRSTVGYHKPPLRNKDKIIRAPPPWRRRQRAWTAWAERYQTRPTPTIRDAPSRSHGLKFPQGRFSGERGRNGPEAGGHVGRPISLEDGGKRAPPHAQVIKRGSLIPLACHCS